MAQEYLWENFLRFWTPLRLSRDKATRKWSIPLILERVNVAKLFICVLFERPTEQGKENIYIFFISDTCVQEAFSLWMLRSGVPWNKHVDLSFASVYIPARYINHYNMPFCVMCFVKDSRNFCGQMFSLQESISVCYRKYLFTWLTPWPDYCCIFSWSKFQPFSAPVLYHTTWPFHSQDLISSSPYYLPYNSYDVSSENLVLDQLIIPWLTFFSILITCLLDIVLIL